MGAVMAVLIRLSAQVLLYVTWLSDSDLLKVAFDRTKRTQAPDQVTVGRVLETQGSAEEADIRGWVVGD